MNINFEKVGRIIIRDENGVIIDRFELGMAQLDTPRERGALKTLHLQKAKKKE